MINLDTNDSPLDPDGMSQLPTDPANSRLVVEYMLELPRDQNVIYHQIDRFSRAAPSHIEYVKLAEKCSQFVEGIQWTKEELAKLESEGRPYITLNKIKPLVFFLLGYFRQNKYEAKVFPSNDGTGTQEVAEVISHLLKQVAHRSKSQWRDAQVFQDGIITGRGFWDSRLDFTRNKLGEVVSLNENPSSILIDPEASTYDPNPHDREGGWQYITQTRWMSASEIFLLFGADKNSDLLTGTLTSNPLSDGVDAYQLSITEDGFTSFGYNHLMESVGALGDFGLDGGFAAPDSHVNKRRKLFRVLDCQHLQIKKCSYLYDMVTGEEKMLPATMPKETALRMVEALKLRGIEGIEYGEAYRSGIRWTITCGNRILWDKWSPYDRYTKVPFFPYFRRGVTTGLVSDLIDPQREVNRRRSAILHTIMATSNAGWMYESGALTEDAKKDLSEYGTTPGVNIEFNKGSQAPQRIHPAPFPSNLSQSEELAARDLKEIAGINESALGNLDVVQSGRAIIARQKQAIVGAEIYFDNFSYSREIKTGLEMSIIQQYYTEERIMRVRGEDNDGDDDTLTINKYDAATGKIINNVSMGNYDIEIDEAPASQSFVSGQLQEALDMRAAGIPIPDETVLKMSSLPTKKSITKRMREERDIALNESRISNFVQRMQMGLPLDQPVPPIVTDSAAVTESTTPMLQPPMGVASPVPVSPDGSMMPPQEQSQAAAVQGQQPQVSMAGGGQPDTMTGGM